MNTEIINQNFSQKNEDLERLMEIDSSIKEIVQSEHKKYKFKLKLLFLVIIIMLIVLFFELKGKTNLFNKFYNLFTVSKKIKPDRANLLPMHFNGKQPLLLQTDDANEKKMLGNQIKVLPVSFDTENNKNN